MADLVERFTGLFQGSKRSFGRYFPGNGKVLTEKAEFYSDHVRQHLRGDTGLGVVPILDDNTCWFAVIDIDCHGEDDPEIDLLKLEQGRELRNLPLVICRSKSGGAHCILFGAEPLPCTQATQLLVEWSAQLGYPGVEIFPKQTRLQSTADGLQLGNWINLPYFNARNTDRYAVGATGQPLSFEEFLDLAESRRRTRSELSKFTTVDHSEAPPCFQQMVANGVQDGFRNEALYHATLYLRRAFPEDWRERAYSFNTESIINPLPMVEAKRSIQSAGRRDYRYKCNAEPCKSLCDRTVCLTRKFGITPEFLKSDDGAALMPEFTAVRHYTTEPPKYEVTADGVVLVLESSDFLKWQNFRFKLMEALGRTVPELPVAVWESTFLNKLLAQRETLVVPEEATAAGLLRVRLRDWLKKAKAVARPEERESVLRGPVRGELNGEVVFMFRAQDFVDHLRRIRAEELRNSQLYMALQPLGMKCKNVRVSKRVLELWVISATVAEDMELEPKQFTTEF